MRNIRFKLAALGAASILVACGGGGGPAVTGLAAGGAAIGNAALTARCAVGAPITGRTNADGSFTLDLSGGQNLPCMVQVAYGSSVIHGYADALGRINVTPLTDMVITRALGSDPAATFSSFDSTKAATLRSGLDAAKAYVKSEITAIAGGAPSGDPLTGTFSVGDADDKILDTLAAKLAAGGKTYADLRAGALSGVPLGAAIDRGTLVEPAVVLTTLTTTQIDAATTNSGLIGLSGAAKCDVKVVSLNYNTIGVKGEKTNASGVMLVPAGSGAGCSSAASLVAYAKGTDVQKPRTLANPADGETFLLAAMYAAQGYAVVATDYLGFAKSAYSYHPYLHADSEASSVIDSIRAARRAVSTAGATLSGKVMLTGYSQGGHSSMAAHRAIERDNAAEINVVAGAHLAGPYNLSGSFKTTSVIAGYQFFVPYLVTAWQKVYGNIYSDVNAVFKAPYATGIESLLPSPTLDYMTLVTGGKLPGINGETPTQARDLLFTSAFITDTQTNDASPLYLAGKKNDTLGWNPKSKLLLCGGAGDPTVPPALHQAVMKADFDSRSLTNVSTVDVDASVKAVYGAYLTNAPATYYGNYHGTYEPPFCHVEARKLFDTVK
ncbi:hypothetical protein BH11PSE7_BH11PSE7_16450 [soil metagenome]